MVTLFYKKQRRAIGQNRRKRKSAIVQFSNKRKKKQIIIIRIIKALGRRSTNTKIFSQKELFLSYPRVWLFEKF